MLRAIMSIVVAASMFLWAGCYQVVTLTREQYADVNRYEDVNVLTDSAGVVTKYHFSKGMCVIRNDTLVGTGTRMSGFGEEEGATVVMPTTKLSVVEVTKLNVPVTLALAGLVVAGTVGAIFLIGSPGASGGPGSQPPTPQ
jgi:hypothetical protein